MAAPNILNPTTVAGKSAIFSLSTSAATIVNNAASSGKLMKVNTLYISNVDGTNAADVTVSVYPQDDIGGTPRKIAHLVTVPAKATLVVIDKDAPVYLEEDRSLGATASADSDLEAVVSWEEIS